MDLERYIGSMALVYFFHKAYKKSELLPGKMLNLYLEYSWPVNRLPCSCG